MLEDFQCVFLIDVLKRYIDYRCLIIDVLLIDGFHRCSSLEFNLTLAIFYDILIDALFF